MPITKIRVHNAEEFEAAQARQAERGLRRLVFFEHRFLADLNPQTISVVVFVDNNFQVVFVDQETFDAIQTLRSCV